MRVIAGRYKSRHLETLAGTRMRPTSDRLRETLFNVLGAEVPGAAFADCYAGSGAVGIEARSRGAKWVYFLENLRPALHVLESNLRALEIERDIEILALDVLAGLRQLERREIPLQLIFLDPPYQAAEEYERALGFLGASKLLAPGGSVIAEHFHKQKLAEKYGVLARARALRQGDSVLSFYRQR